MLRSAEVGGNNRQSSNECLLFRDVYGSCKLECVCHLSHFLSQGGQSELSCIDQFRAHDENALLTIRRAITSLNLSRNNCLMLIKFDGTVYAQSTQSARTSLDSPAPISELSRPKFIHPLSSHVTPHPRHHLTYHHVRSLPTTPTSSPHALFLRPQCLARV